LRTLRELPPGARITGLTLRRLADNAPLFTRELAAGQTWDTALTGDKTEVQGAVQQLLGELRTLKVRDFVRDNFTTTLELNGQAQPWVYQLDVAIALSSAGEGAETKTTSTLLLGDRQGGTSLLVGSAEFNTVFHATQTFLDSVFTLTFGARDPGPPPAQPQNAVDPAVPAPQP
jgi:hypothetical protein